MLPIFQTIDKAFSLFQTSWASKINPVLDQPQSKGVLISAALINGTTIINHTLGRSPQGWLLTDIDGAADVYRSQPFNNLTLTLHSSAGVNVSLWVF